jgi:hypothetical protein
VKLVDDIRAHLAESWIADLYKNKVRSQRTRSIHLDVPARENRPEIFHTLLGIELKVGKRRFACPDLATARYLRVFARIGSTDLAVPYDITRISVIADELETSWQKMILMIEKELLDAAVEGRVRSALVRKLREEIRDVGPGDVMPSFDRETKQRK